MMRQKTLLDIPIPEQETFSPLHSDMIRVYGKGEEGQQCKHCIHLIRHSHSGRYFKCSKALVTSGAATDWRGKWPTCGLYERKD